MMHEEWNIPQTPQTLSQEELTRSYDDLTRTLNENLDISGKRGIKIAQQAEEIESLKAELEHAMQWRDLALQFDRHRMSALGMLKGVVAGTATPTECRLFLEAPPKSGSEIVAEHTRLRELLVEARRRMVATSANPEYEMLKMMIDAVLEATA